MATIIFNFGFVNNASPQVVLTSTELTGAAAPTVNISSTAIADGTTIASVVSGGALVYDTYTATWSYRLASADLSAYVYKAKATTTYATASPASVQCLGIVIPDELTSTRLATSGYTAPLTAVTTRSALGLATANLDTQLDALPTAAENADAVWDEVMGHTTASTAGKLLATAATDLLLNTVPGSYASGTAGAALGAIGSGTASVVSAISGTSLTITAAATFTATVSGLTIGSTWTALYFTLKASQSDADTAARVQIRVSNPGALTDGLLYLNGAAGTAAQAALVVSQSAGTVAITITDNATAMLAQTSGLYYDLKALYSAAGSSTVLATGYADVTLTPTKAI